jgi:periplasmic divalent cation tolerance protein
MTADALALITTTAPDQANADAIAKALMEARLAACVQMHPIFSVYRWQGAVETAPEVALLIKSRAALFDAVCVAIKRVHPYEVPEILMTRLTGADPAYAAWVEEAIAAS